MTFNANDTTEEILNKRNQGRQTTLTAWFENNAKELENPLPEEKILDKNGNIEPRGPELHYFEYPKYYTYSNGKWVRRARKEIWAVARLHSASPNQGQRWYLHILLCHVKGATSFANLLTYAGKQYNCFKDRCFAEELIDIDNEPDKAMSEAKVFKSPRQMRRLFINLLCHCDPPFPLELWHKYKDDMIEDFKYKYTKKMRQTQNNTQNTIINNEIKSKMYNSALYEICTELTNYNKDLNHFKFIKPQKKDCFQMECSEILAEKSFNANECKKLYKSQYKQMNKDQQHVFDTIKNVLYPNATSSQINSLHCLINSFCALVNSQLESEKILIGTPKRECMVRPFL